MKSVQGLISSSKINDGDEDNDVALSPDENGGFGFGIWDTLYGYIGFAPDYNVRPVGTCGYGVQICHKFSEEECKEVLKFLKKWKEKKVKHKGEKIKAMRPPEKHFESSDEDPFSLEKKWYNRLKELFSNFDDLPIYYKAG